MEDNYLNHRYLLGRRMNRRSFLRAGALAGAGLAVGSAIGCGGTSAPKAATTPAAAVSPAATTPSAVAPFSLKAWGSGGPGALDPHNTSSSPDATRVRHICSNGLVIWDHDLRFQPDLAESWKVSEDGLTYTFKLRDNLKFSNGKKVTAKLVVENFEHILDPASGSFLRTDYMIVDKVAPKDDLTVEFKLVEPSSVFLPILSHRTFITDMSAYSKTDPVGAGPWLLKDWLKGSHMKFARNPDFYAKGFPMANDLTLVLTADEDAAFNALRTKQIDIGSVPTKSMKQYEGSKEIIINKIGGLSATRILLNCKDAPFNDIRMRQAINLAINKQEIVDAVLWGQGEVTNVPFAKGNPWRAEIPEVKQDKEKAKQLIAEAGFTGWSYDMPTGNGAAELKFGEMFQAQLKEVGLNLNLVPMDTAGAFHPLAFAGKFLITYSGWTGRPDPDQEFYPKYRTGGPHNVSKYSVPQMDSLLDKARVELDEKKRKDMYVDVQKMLVADLPQIYVYIGLSTAASQPYVKGFRVHPDSGLVYYEKSYFEK